MKTLIIILILAVLVVPVSAITYSDEYYKMGNTSDDLYPHDDFVEYLSKLSGYTDLRYYYITVTELRRQTILMEKQNELLEEQNNLTRQQMDMKLKCTNQWTGFCREYSWMPS